LLELVAESKLELTSGERHSELPEARRPEVSKVVCVVSLIKNGKAYEPKFFANATRGFESYRKLLALRPGRKGVLLKGGNKTEWFGGRNPF